MIDLQARAKIRQQQQQQAQANGMFSSVFQALELKQENKEMMKEVVAERQKMQEVFDKLSRALVLVYKKIPGSLDLPKKFQIFGNVKVDSLPDVKVSNLSEVSTHLKALSLQMQQLKEAISFVGKQAPPEITIPPIAIDGAGVLERGLKNIEGKLDDQAKALLLLAKQKPVRGQDIKIPTLDVNPLIEAIDRIPGGSSNADVVDKLADLERVMSAIYEKPQMTPQPVTNMSINALQGTFHATTMNVSTVPTALPTTALANRRSLLIYNNSSNTIYLGDIDVATSGTGQGLPIPANSYSPPFQAGSNMTVYGIAGSTSSVTVLEMSDESVGR